MSSLAPLMLVALLLGACAPMPQQLREMVNDGRNEDAIARGEKFLEDNRFGPALPEEMYEVETLIARASLNVARQRDTVEAYRTFRKNLPETQATVKLLTQAYNFEAAAWYRDITLRADSLQAHKAFRKRYPDSEAVARSRLREAQIAFGLARQAGTMQALDRFYMLYKRWPEAAPVLKQAQQLEAQVGFDHAKRTASVDVWRAFNARFAGSSWAKRGLPMEATLALKEARSRNTVAAYRAFAQRYAAVGGIGHLLGAARSLEVEAAWMALGQAPSDATLVRFLQHYEFWPEASRQGPAARVRLARLRLSVAVSRGTPEALESYLQVHKDWKLIGDVLGQARKALVVVSFAGVKTAGTRAAYEAFIEKFQSWPEARREVVEAAGLARGAK